MARLGGVQDIYQLAGGDIVKADGVLLRSHSGKVTVEGARGLAEQHAGIFGLRAVGVQFDENPVWSPIYGHVALKPHAQTFHSGRIQLG